MDNLIFAMMISGPWSYREMLDEPPPPRPYVVPTWPAVPPKGEPDRARRWFLLQDGRRVKGWEEAGMIRWWPHEQGQP